MDDPIEIVTKKVFYRGDQILPRDIFDLATVYEDRNRKKQLVHTLKALPKEVLDIFFKHFESAFVNTNFKLYSINFSDMLLVNGTILRGRELQICQELINHIKREE